MVETYTTWHLWDDVVHLQVHQLVSTASATLCYRIVRKRWYISASVIDNRHNESVLYRHPLYHLAKGGSTIVIAKFAAGNDIRL